MPEKSTATRMNALELYASAHQSSCSLQPVSMQDPYNQHSLREIV